MAKTHKKNTAYKRNKPRRVAKTVKMKGQQNNRPFRLGIASPVPEYIAPTGIAASIGRFLGSLGKPKR